MQTFMPYPSYEESARVLDGPRLGKQRVEAYQILLQLCGVRMVDYPEWEPRLGGWNHPAMAMWSGHEIQLLEYIRAMCNEWTGRGYRDTCLDKSQLVIDLIAQEHWSTDKPQWIGDEDVHLSHRHMLLWKDLGFYGKRFPDDVPDDPSRDDSFLDYVWPTTAWGMSERKSINFELAKSLKM